ncbi:MAG: 50S ribosomal protein L3 [Candidatus Omnitrophota bacterium]
MIGILGKKIGMTQVFTDDGAMVSVTVVEAGPCLVLSVKDKSLQLGFEEVNEKRLTKPLSGFFKKINIPCRRLIKELPKDASKEYKVGDELKVDIFSPGDYVDVTGVSIGKGFQGGMKRWNWSGGPQTHGSTSHRRVGSIGATSTPGRVWKGFHMPGHMGNKKVTLQNLKVIKTDIDNNILLIKGAVPGAKNGYLVIRKAKKKLNKTLKASVAQDKKVKK